MTPRLTEIAKRVEAATEGPWVCDLDGSYETRCAETDLMNIHAPVKVQIDQTLQDAEFIAHAREDVPFLLALVSSLQAEVAAFEEAISGSFDWESAPLGETIRAIRDAREELE